MPAKKYTDFDESLPFERIAKHGARDAKDTRQYVSVRCPHCAVRFIDIPLDSLKTNKASECKKHLLRCPKAKAAGVVVAPVRRVGRTQPEPQVAPPPAPPVATPVAPPPATPVATPTACCAASRRPLEERLDEMREEQASQKHVADLRHAELIARHAELIAEVREAKALRDSMAHTVALPFRISPPDAITVSRELRPKVDFHLARMTELQRVNAVQASQLAESKRAAKEHKRAREAAEAEATQAKRARRAAEAKAARLRSNCAAEPRVEAALAKLRAVERTFHPDKARGATFTATEVSAVLHDLRDLLRGA